MLILAAATASALWSKYDSRAAIVLFLEDVRVCIIDFPLPLSNINSDILLQSTTDFLTVVHRDICNVYFGQ